MGASMYVVPIDEFDVAWHEAAIRGARQIEVGDERFPSDEAITAAAARIDEIARELAALSPAHRAASRWPTKSELESTLRGLAATRGYEVWFGPHNVPWTSATLSRYEPGTSTIASDLALHLTRGDRYYCSAHADMLAEFARAIAEVAGPQVTFIGDDFSDAEFTALVVPTQQRGRS